MKNRMSLTAKANTPCSFEPILVRDNYVMFLSKARPFKVIISVHDGALLDRYSLLCAFAFLAKSDTRMFCFNGDNFTGSVAAFIRKYSNLCPSCIHLRCQQLWWQISEIHF